MYPKSFFPPLLGSRRLWTVRPPTIPAMIPPKPNLLLLPSPPLVVPPLKGKSMPRGKARRVSLGARQMRGRQQLVRASGTVSLSYPPHFNRADIQQE